MLWRWAHLTCSPFRWSIAAMINRMSGQLYLVTSGTTTTTVSQVLQICIQSMLNRCLHKYKYPLRPFTLATCTGWMDVWLTGDPPDWDCAVQCTQTMSVCPSGNRWRKPVVITFALIPMFCGWPEWQSRKEDQGRSIVSEGRWRINTVWLR